MNNRLSFAAAAALVSLFAANGAARAQSADIKTVVSTNGSVVLDQTSPTNLAGVFMIGGATSAIVTQQGSNNAAGILQFGTMNGASVSQNGALNLGYLAQAGQTSNLASITQMGGLNLSMITQIAR